MKLNLTLVALTLVALFSTGCNYETPVIEAEAPGGGRPMTNSIQTTGHYTLYHVTQFDDWGAPIPSATTEIKTIDLKVGDKIGFNYVSPADKKWEMDAQSDLYGYAGSYSVKLGAIQSMSDHYYWANPDDWAGFWSMRPERVLAKRATLY